MKDWKWLGLVLVLAGCASSLPPPERPSQVPDFPQAWNDQAQGWWNRQVFYEVFVRAFQDSNGDGKGDLKGLIQRLDYLKELGVTALWLMPVFEAHSGHGYDTLDYKKIDPDYGTNEDFKELMAQAHKRGIKVILDLVLNHTSDRHPWFQAQLKDPQGPYRDYYFISKTPFNNKNRQTKTPEGTFNFYGLFDATMPDLNYTNPKVTQEMLSVVDYWIRDMGADGYRLDAIKYLIEDGPVLENTYQTHTWLKEKFYPAVKRAHPQGFTVGEVWDSDEVITSYTGDQMDICFHFPLSQDISQALTAQNVLKLRGTLSAALKDLPPNQWGTFLRNHDQKRLMKDFDGDEARGKAAAGLLLTLPGVPFIYYGEEIGLRENRRAMQWEPGAQNWGFSTAARVYNNGHQEGGEGRSVADQKKSPGSLWSAFQKYIQIRLSRPELQTGYTALVDTGSDQVLAYLRWNGSSTSLVVANLSAKPLGAYGLTLWKGPLKADETPKDLLSGGTVKGPQILDGGFVNWKPWDTLEPWSVKIIGF